MNRTFTKLAATFATAAVAAVGLAAVIASAAGAAPGADQELSLAQVGNYLLVAGECGPTICGVSTGSNRVQLMAQTVGSSSGWGGALVTAPGTVYSAVSLAPLGGSLIGMVAEGPNNSLMFWWQTTAELVSPWNQEMLRGPGTTFSAPSIQVIDNQVVVSAEGPSNSLNIMWQTIGAPTTCPGALPCTGWNGYLGQFPGLVYTQPTMAAMPSGQLAIAWSESSPYDCTTYTEQLPANFGEAWPFYYPDNACISAGSSIAPTISGVAGGMIVAQASNYSLDTWTSQPGYFAGDQRLLYQLEAVIRPGIN